MGRRAGQVLKKNYQKLRSQKVHSLLQHIFSLIRSNSFKQVGLYTATGTLTKIISFAALPFFVNILTEGDIGILNIFSSTIVFLTPVISMGALYTISVDYFKMPGEEYAKVFTNSLLIPLCVSFLVVPAIYIFRHPLANAFSFQDAFLWLIPACLFLNFCFEALIILLRNQNNVKAFSFVSLTRIVIEIGLAVLFILFFVKSWYSRALGYFLSLAVTFVFFLAYISRQQLLVRKIDFTILRRELLFGLSGVLLQTGVFFINSSDKFFVMAFFGKEQTGFYGIAGTFATIQFIISVSLLQYLQPVLFRKFSEKAGWKELRPIYKKYILVMLAAVAALAVFTVIVYDLVLKPSYRQYLHYFFMLCISGFIWSLSNLFLQYIIFSKSKKIIAGISVAAIASAVAVNYAASHFLSINWLCLGQMVTNIFVLCIILYYCKKLHCFE